MDPELDETDLQTRLLGEQFQHAVDLISSRISSLQADQNHRQELLDQRMRVLEQSQTDQEARLRAVTEGVIRLNTQGSLAAVGQSILSLILAAIAAWIGAHQ